MSTCEEKLNKIMEILTDSEETSARWRDRIWESCRLDLQPFLQRTFGGNSTTRTSMGRDPITDTVTITISLWEKK